MNYLRIVGMMWGAGKTAAVWAVIIMGLAAPALAQDADLAAKLAKYREKNKKFTTKSGRIYDTSGIQKVTGAGVTVITNDGIGKVRPDDLTAEFREWFGLTTQKVQEAESASARKRHDSKKAAARKRNAEKRVKSRKHRLRVEVLEEVEFGFICEAQFIEEVIKHVQKKVRADTFAADRSARTKIVAVKKKEAVGVAEPVLVRGLPGALKPGGKWEGDVYVVGLYVHAPKMTKRGRKGLPPMDIPMAFVRYKEAVAYSAATPDDGSEGNASGTGVAICKDGLILTSYRLVLDADQIMVTIPGRNKALKAKVVARDKKENIAVLKVASLLKPAPVLMTPAIVLGQAVFTIGYPDVNVRSRQMKISEGSVAALKGAQDDSRFFQVDGDFEAGNFGGAIFNKKGFVIGVITPNPPESFFLEEGGADFAPLQYVTKGSRFKNLLKSIGGFEPTTAAPANARATAQGAAILVQVKRRAS